jgi:myo-inositol-1(or 4)-monophosphatase
MKRGTIAAFQPEALLSEVTATAIAAGKLLLRNVSRHRSVHFKGRINLVTEMDLKSEKLIVAQLRKLLPDASFLTEEGSAVENDSPYKWVIDPLDGTTNYAHTFPIWCVSIALEWHGEIVLGCVYDPNRDELFTALRDKPARLNGKLIHVSDHRQLHRSLLATGFPYDVQTSSINNLDHFVSFAKTARAIRRAGSAALDLCYLAKGRFDGFWELKLHPWDTAAGILIVKQAGGRVTDFHGKPFSIYSEHLLASNGAIHSQMIRVLAISDQIVPGRS